MSEKRNEKRERTIVNKAIPEQEIAFPPREKV
jgi:hypothetical protein